MLVPASRVPGATARPYIQQIFSVVRPVSHLFFRLPEPATLHPPVARAVAGPISVTSKSTGTTRAALIFRSAAPRMLALFGRPGTDSLVGPTALHYVLRRNISGIATEVADVAAECTPMDEPYGSVIKSVVEPEMRRLGYFKTGSDEYSVAFSDGVRTLEIVSERYVHPSATAIFATRSGRTFQLWGLQMVMNPTAYQAEQDALQAILKKYGVNERGTSLAVREEGMRLYLELSFKQMIQFFKANKNALHDLY